MQPDQSLRESYFLLMDPQWRPQPGDEAPPMEAVVGLWPLAADGAVGSFRSNPGYLPRDQDAVTDPLDAMLRLVLQGRARAERLQVMMRDALLGAAVGGDGRPLIALSPDQVRCVMVATSVTQQRRVSSPDWQQVDLMALVGLLPDGVDVLFNPDGPVPFRLTGDFVRETAIMSDEDVAAAHASMRAELAGQQLEVIPWILDDEQAEVTRLR